MNLLITGGAGFIGSHLVEHMLAAGNTVRVLDNLSTGKRENLPAHSRLEFVLGDIRDRGLVLECVRDVQAIIHLAAVASVQASVDDPTGTHETNFDGTLHLLEAARKEKNWQHADSLRGELQKMGYAIEDTSDGPRLSKKQ